MAIFVYMSCTLYVLYFDVQTYKQALPRLFVIPHSDHILMSIQEFELYQQMHSQMFRVQCSTQS